MIENFNINIPDVKGLVGDSSSLKMLLARYSSLQGKNPT
jgi:hypothetical protein